MGTDGLGAVSTGHTHTCVGTPQGRDGPSAALGVEVEQGAAGEADDKLGEGGRRRGGGEKR